MKQEFNNERYTVEVHDFVFDTGNVIIRKFYNDDADYAVAQAYGWSTLHDGGYGGYYQVIIHDHLTGTDQAVGFEMIESDPWETVSVQSLARDYFNKGFTCVDGDEILADIEHQLDYAHGAQDIGYWTGARDMLVGITTWISQLEMEAK